MLLKWSSVAFSLLQLAVFLLILFLKLYPRLENQFPFLPESFLGSGAGGGQHSGGSGGHEVYLAVPHGTTLEEKDLIIKPSSKSPSSDPPDPGGLSNSTLNSSNSTRIPYRYIS